MYNENDEELTTLASTIKNTLSTPYKYTIPLQTDEIQYGRIAICQQHNLILLYENQKLILYNDVMEIDEKLFSFRQYGGVGSILWCESIKRFLILTYSHLYTLPLNIIDKDGSETFTLGNLDLIDPIRSFDAFERRQKKGNRLRFITLKGDHDIFLNRGYHTLEEWSIQTWIRARKWSKNQLNYENHNEIKLITCSRDGKHMAMNISLTDQLWAIDFRSTDGDLPLLKRIEPFMDVSFHHKLDISNLCQEDNVTSTSEWLIINDENSLYTIGVNKKPDKPQLLKKSVIQEQVDGPPRLYFHWFLDNKFLIMSKPCVNQTGELCFFEAT